MPSRFQILPCAILLLILCGCTSTSSAPPDSTTHARCPVCLHNADLACLDVRIDSQTPRSVYRGQTYYFCSPDCKVAFDKNPEKYR